MSSLLWFIAGGALVLYVGAYFLAGWLERCFRR